MGLEKNIVNEVTQTQQGPALYVLSYLWFQIFRSQRERDHHRKPQSVKMQRKKSGEHRSRERIYIQLLYLRFQNNEKESEAGQM